MSTTTTTPATGTVRRRHLPPARSLARVATAALGVFAGGVVVAAALDPGYSHRSDAMSSLAAQDASAGSVAVMTVAFAALAVTLLAAGASLLSTLRGKAAVAGSLLVLLSGAAAVVVGIARLDCSPLTSAACRADEHAGTVSGAHVAHNLVSLVLFLSLVVGLFLVASAVRRNPARRHLARRARVAAVAALLLMVWFGSAAYGDNGGLVQRLLVLVSVGWPVYLATAVSSAPRDRAIAPGADMG